ncbi:hypothetical protein LNP04_04210 [Chryseobacterium sp. C-71]|uniref:DNA-directed RNA polymerase subunit alpha C-terminal domain-containing protein n=1 Tax=Chryseobacterium sp. C-71 TaxID=2893882 RepID=UPI001E5BE6AC|nr:DNA-directed RNA polymerase subunit alpha C-terminal domain-containing protein [Chryseobacterium sp. C-71]UFH32930.1 hypothetical protein LNP04_04210 [Chryseobacterium sp. C-71]
MAKSIKAICIDRHSVSNDFLKGIVAMPARRALEKKKIDSLEKLTDYSEEELLQFHGFGKTTIQKLKIYMRDHGKSFKL